MITIVQIDETFDRVEELLALIMSSFAYMDGVIDPPSSAHRLTPDNLRQKIRDEIAFVAFDDGDMLGCIFCKPEAASLYVGKLAVSPAAQGRGIGKALLRTAKRRRTGCRSQACDWRPGLNSSTITGSFRPGASSRRLRIRMPDMSGSPLSK